MAQDPTPEATPGQAAEPPAVLATADKVESFLQEFGSFSRVDETSFFAKRGSTVVAIEVLPWAEDALVVVSADVVQGADLGSPDLMRMLLEHNHASYFGFFGVRPEDGVITLHHALRGSTLDREELLPAVVEVARVADDWDDEIIAIAGGRTAADRLREEVARRNAPRPTIEPARAKEP